ncbi:MAG: hypothetical protein IKY70_07420 [Bacteroidales bacterium]|nr:hypothetical protein [Bacteroidales bacterium]
MQFWPFVINDNKMYMAAGADRLIELAEKYSSQRMKEIAVGLNEECNPVLVVATLK